MIPCLRIESMHVDGYHLAEFHAPDGTVPAYTGLSRTKHGNADVLRGMLRALVTHFQDDVQALEDIRAILEPTNFDSSPPIAKASCVESPVTGGCSPGGGTVSGGEGLIDGVLSSTVVQ